MSLEASQQRAGERTQTTAKKEEEEEDRVTSPTGPLSNVSSWANGDCADDLVESRATSVEAEAKATFDELFAERGKGGGNGDVAGGGGADSTTTTTTTFADADSGTASLSASDRQQLTPDQMAALLAEGIDAAEIEGIQERLANEAEAEIEAAENAQTGGGGGGGGGAESLGGGDDGASELWGGDRPDVERLPSSEALKRAGVDPQATGGALPEFILSASRCD